MKSHLWLHRDQKNDERVENHREKEKSEETERVIEGRSHNLIITNKNKGRYNYERKQEMAITDFRTRAIIDSKKQISGWGIVWTFIILEWFRVFTISC